MKKKIVLLIFGLFIIFSNIKMVYADNACTVEAAKQLAKIIYNEVGADSARNYEENFFMKATTASVVINNASTKNGNNWYQKIYNLTDGNYDRYSTYKASDFESVVPANRRGEMLYIAELVLSGKYNVPKNIYLQASQSIVNSFGTVWTYVATSGYDVYFGYTGASLANQDVFGQTISNTSASYYRQKANGLKLSDYSKYTTSSVCKGLSGNTPTSPSTPTPFPPSEKPISIIENACTDPDILRVIYFIKLIIRIVKIILPIGLIIMGMIDFSKSVVTSDEGVQKKNIQLFVKRIIFAVLVFAVPWIVEFVMVNLGNLTEGVNFTDCLENSESDIIKAIEDGTYVPSVKDNSSCYYCASSSTYMWQENVPSENCPGGIGWSKQSGINSESECK